MNGNVADKFLSSIDPDDPEYQRQLMRPAEIKEDVKLMEQRKRVSLILNSEAFREELEQIIESQLCSGPQSVSLLALQQIADALQLPRSTGTQGTQGGASATPVRTAAPSAAAPLPINDIRGVESLNYSKGEKLLRCKLASACRLLDLFGWASPTPAGTLLSARVPDRDGAPPTFLTTAYGLLAHEITASSLLKLDARGVPIEAGCTPFGPATTWRSLDAPLYAARATLRCVLHVRTPATVALSATRKGITRLTLEAVECGRVAILDSPEAPAGVGDANVLLIRNMGIVCLGESVEEAFYFAQRAVQACEAQVTAAALGADQLCELDDAQCDAVRSALDAQLAALPKLDPTSQDAQLTKADGSDATNWMRGELEFEALMRYLDNAGFRTGYPYRIPVIKHGHAHKSREQHPEIELPPTVSSLAEELQQFDLTHGSGHATQLLKEVSAAKKSATLPAGGIRKTPKAADARANAFPSTTDDIKVIVAPELRDAKPAAPVSVSVTATAAAPAKPQPTTQSKPLSPEKPQVAAAQSPPATTSSASPLARTESARAQPLPLANEYSNAAAGATLEISTPVGNLSTTASLQRPARVDRSKSERVPAASLKVEVSGTDEQPDEDGAGKKDKKNKSGIFASFSKKKEKAK